MEYKKFDIPYEFGAKRPIYKVRFRGLLSDAAKKDTEHYHLYPADKNTYYVSGYSLKALERLSFKLEVVATISPEEIGISITSPLRVILHDIPTVEACEEILALALSQKARKGLYKPIYCGRTHEPIPDSFVMDRPGGRRHYRWLWDRRKTKRSVVGFQDRFPKLIKLMKDPDTRFVLSLGAGGLRLFAHPSIFRLIEALGTQNYIEEIWGCSGGALAGLANVLGADKQIIEHAGYEYYNQKYNVRLSPSATDVIKNVIVDRFLPGTKASLQGFINVQHDIEHLLARVAKHHKPTVPFFAIAYNMSARRNEVLTPTNVNSSLYDGVIKHCSPINAVLASAAIPVLFVPRIIKRGETPITYIDGSIFEEIPLASVYYKWRIDKKHDLTKKKRLFILAVNLAPQLHTWKIFGKFLSKYVPFFELIGILTRLADLARRARIEDQIRTISADHNARISEVNLALTTKFNILDPRIIPLVIDKAHNTFFDQLLKIEAGLPD